MGIPTGTTDKILMIRPVNFGFNTETAGDNTFQKVPEIGTTSSIQSQALLVFNTLTQKLISIGVDVLIVDDTQEPPTPDSIFPNNWISFHEDGTICLFPMYAKNRRLERKSTVLEAIHASFQIQRTVDLTSSELDDMFLEGTGSMILDRPNGIVYGSHSARTNENVLQNFATVMGFPKIIMFESHNSGKLIYHTNVMMCLGDKFVVICLDCISDPIEREYVKNTIQESGKEVVVITIDQMNNFAGNMLQVENILGQKYLVMSSRAYNSLTPEQIHKLEMFNQLVHSDLTTIEDIGGGSARCMMAEIYLHPKIN